MQYTHSELYEDASTKNTIPLHEVKFVGDIVFNAMNKNLKFPEEIILKIKHLGKFFMRNVKLNNELDLLGRRLAVEETEEGKKKLADRIELLQERRKDYDAYLSEKGAIKKIRREYQKPIKNNISEEEI